jgi:hypothetical protein
MTNKGMAKDTLDILAKKYYINEYNEKINIENELEISKKETTLFTPEQLSEIAESSLPETAFETRFETRNCSSLKAILELAEEENQEKLMCLNFARQKIPEVALSMVRKHRKKVWQEHPDCMKVCCRHGIITRFIAQWNPVFIQTR